jgi:hypothetical protein
MPGQDDRNKIAADDELASAVLQRQEVFRAVNEQIEQLGSTFEPESSWLILVCECGDAACREHVELPRDVYEDVREDPLRFVIKPGHEMLGSDWIVACEPGYYLVEKSSVHARTRSR